MKRTTGSLPTSRIIFLRTIVALVFLFVIGRLFQISVIEHPQAVVKAKNQYGIKQTIEAKRGHIYFQNLNTASKYPVALNVDSYTVIADPFIIKDARATASALAGLLAEKDTDIEPKITDKHKRFVVLKKKLTKDQAKKVEELNLKGITVQTIPSRYYPEASLGSHLVGFVNGESEGQYGIEGFFNEDLKGYDGSFVGQKDAKRRIIEENDSAKPRDGSDIVLTIDNNLQYVVEQKLKAALKLYEAESGTVVIMDVKTGAIRALANMPDYDLNNYGTVPQDQQHVFSNTAVSNSWEPGSIFKTFTLAAGMDMGLFEPETELELPCFMKINGFEIRNAEDKCYTKPNLIRVLADSINVGTIWAADKLGNDNFAKYLSDFGFGTKTGIEIQPEASGKIQEPKRWQDVTRATYSFGQGLTTTPVQMVAAYASIANGGKLMHPYIVDKRIDGSGKEIVTSPREVRQVVKPETAAKTNLLLEKTVTEGHAKRAGVPGYRVAGKTGTAQVVGDDGRYAENQHIGALAGYFPSNDPQFAMVVKLDKPKAVEFAESSAGPLFGEIAGWLLHYAKIPPTEPIK